MRVELAMKVLHRDGRVPGLKTATDVSPCLAGSLNPQVMGSTPGAQPRPLVSFLLQYFRRPGNIARLVDSTVGACKEVFPVELVVNVDDPQDAATWAQLSYNTSGAVVPVFSANLHEARAYNRLAHLARGKYIVLMQDDEAMPANCSWLRSMVTQFEHWPALGVVGLKTFQLNLLGNNPHDNRDELFMDPLTKVKFLFAMYTEYAPFAARRSSFLSVGGVDETQSEPGACGIWSDFELSMRMWAAGYQVGWMRLDGRQHDGQEGSTHRPEAVGPCWGRQMAIGKSVYEDRYSEDWRLALAQHVKDLNYATLTPLYTKCPWGAASGGCPPGTPQ